MLSPNENAIIDMFDTCVIDIDEKYDPEDVKLVHGVDKIYRFSRNKLGSCFADIIEQIRRLPDRFDDGWDINQANRDKDEKVWGPVDIAEELILLGMAVGVIEYSLPRPLWYLLPGGTPYVRRRLPVPA